MAPSTSLETPDTPQPKNKSQSGRKNDGNALHIGLSSGVGAGADFFAGLMCSNVIFFAIFPAIVLWADGAAVGFLISRGV
jgi:hypothetical protein